MLVYQREIRLFQPIDMACYLSNPKEVSNPNVGEYMSQNGSGLPIEIDQQFERFE
jgi:hypothetical protein